MAKYRNTKIKTADGLTFDSKGEYERWLFLCDAQRRGEIQDLQRQVTLKLSVCKYICDFTYLGKGLQKVYEDYKGMRTPIFNLKEKMVAHELGIKLYVINKKNADIGGK
jgi:hypothetical protein